MKLTVCFGQVKVIVPCGDGDLTVKELIEKATSRYVKASLQENIEVDVKYLQTEDDAILDNDDVINDVCDDKDKLIAIFQEKTSLLPQSVNYRPLSSSKSMAPNNVTSSKGNEYTSVTGYSVTEFSTNQIDRIQPVAPPPEFDNDRPPRYYNRDGEMYGNPEIKNEKRNGREWRREAPWKSSERSSQPTKAQSLNSSSTSSTPVSSPDATKDPVGFNRFDRNLNRKTLSTAHPMLYSWIDAQERISEDVSFTNNVGYSKEKRFSESRGSLSGPSIGDYDDHDEISSISSEEIELETRLKEDFGLKVQGYKNAEGKELGLIVHEIKNDSVVGKSGSLNVADRITEVNGINLRGMTNFEAEAVLNEALADGPVKLKRTRSHHFIRASLRNVSMEKHMSLPKVSESAILSCKEAPRVKPAVTDTEIHEAPIEDPKNAAPAPKPHHGDKILIELSKGTAGLGFSITSRDITTGGHNPVYIKNILPKGAAITDGRLKVGDQIIEINGVDVSGKDQANVARTLKSASGIVKLLVNRQNKEVIDPEDNEEAMETVSNDSGISAMKDEFLTITIPLNDLGSAGLGISVKGKSTEDNLDLGIFVKSIIKGGAAAKDGRLKAEDRLLQINNISLDGFSNDKAMDSLRSALRESVKQETKVKLVVSRKAKIEHNQLVSDSKPELQASVRPTIPVLEPQKLTSSHGDSKDPRPPKREKRVVDTSLISKRSNDAQTDITSKPPSGPDTVKFVSISSSEIPRKQPSRPVAIEKSSAGDPKYRQLVEVKSTVFPKQKEFFYQNSRYPEPENLATDENSNLSSKIHNPPSYNEALKRLSISSSETSSNKSSQKNFPSMDTMINPTSEMSVPEMRPKYLIDDAIDSADFIRTMSTSSRFSLDSLVLSPEAMPFSRDAFGRLSMSERKGRAHLDATKSTLYTKLKKSKSLENVHSVNSLSDAFPMELLEGRPPHDAIETDIVPFREAARRTESLDTLLSNTHIASDEEEIFHRNTTLSKSTPSNAQRIISPTVLKARSRSTALNNSFRTAVDKSKVFYTQNGGSVASKTQDDAIPIQLTSNANYYTSHQTKKRSGIFKGLGNLLKKNKPRKMDSKNDRKEKEMFLFNDRGDAEVEKLIDFPRRQRPHSMHEDIASNSSREVSDPIREKERAKRAKEDRVVSLQRELHHVQKSENVIQNNLVKNQAERRGSKENFDDKTMDKLSRHQVSDEASVKSGTHKSLLQRGQERVLQREKNQHNVNPQMDMKPAVKQGNMNARSRKSLTNELNKAEKDEYSIGIVASIRYDAPNDPTVQHANRSRPFPRQDNSEVNITVDRPNYALDSRMELAAGSQNKKTIESTRDSERNRPSLPGDAKNNVDEESGPKQRYLPDTPLFYYGHSSLPRKFTIHNVRKKSLGDVKQPGIPVEERNGTGKRGKPPIRGGDRKFSDHVNVEHSDVHRIAQQTVYVGDARQPGFSIEEQTEAFIRAQQDHDLRTSKRALAQVRNQMQSNGAPTERIITISHAADI